MVTKENHLTKMEKAKDFSGKKNKINQKMTIWYLSVLRSVAANITSLLDDYDVLSDI